MLFVFSFPSTCAWLSDSLEHDSAAISAEEQQASVTKVYRRCPGDPKCGGRERMEESYETFEEELRPTSTDPPPQKAVRQIHRPEMYATRKIREEMPPVSQQQRAEPKTFPREPSIPRTTSMHKTLSIQNPMKIETPWENVTLNRCLFVAITILVLTSGFQKLHEVLRGQGAAEGEEDGLMLRQSRVLRHRGQTLEPETSLWEVMLWWLPDFDDEDEEDDDGEVKRGRAKKGAMARTSRGLRNKPLPDKKLMRQRDRKLIKRNMRAMKTRYEDIKEKEKRNKKKDLEEEEPGDRDEEVEETVPKNSRKLEEKKEKKKSQKG